MKTLRLDKLVALIFTTTIFGWSVGEDLYLIPNHGRYLLQTDRHGVVRIMRKKSIWAVAAGVLVIIVVTTLVDIVLHAISVFPPLDQPINDALALLATSYRIVISIGGAWLTARLAPDKPIKHAMILGVVGTVLGLVGVVATWNRGLGPRWYPIALAVLAIPQCFVGARLYVMRSGKL